MTGEADLAAVGALLSDRTRATILTTLLNGGLTPASKLAERAGVSRSLASSHLRKLTEGGLIVVEPRRRQRLYRLAGQQVADALEVLLLMAPLGSVSSLKSSRERDALREGRLCYDHLAGRQGVALTDGMLAGRLLTPTPGGYTVTARGATALRSLAIDVDELRERPRQLTRACMDRSEGRYHLAGSLGAAITGELQVRGWLATREASRVVDLTDDGRAGLQDALGVTVPEDDEPSAPPAAHPSAAPSSFAAPGPGPATPLHHHREGPRHAR